MHGSIRMTEQPGIDKWIISSTGYKILKRFEVFQKDEIYQITVSLKTNQLPGLFLSSYQTATTIKLV